MSTGAIIHLIACRLLLPVDKARFRLGTTPTSSHAYAALMQSSVTPFGMFCSNQFPGIRLVPVWLDTEPSSPVHGLTMLVF